MKRKYTQKCTQIPITMSVYKIEMDRIVKLCKHKDIDEALMIMLKEASKYKIVASKRRTKG